MDFWQLLGKKRKGITFTVKKCNFSVLSEKSMVPSLQETMCYIETNRGKLNCWASVPPKDSRKLRETFSGLYKFQKLVSRSRRSCPLKVILPNKFQEPLFLWPSPVSLQCFGIIQFSSYLLLPETWRAPKPRPSNVWFSFVFHPASNSLQTSAPDFWSGTLPTLSARQVSYGCRGYFSLCGLRSLP